MTLTMSNPIRRLKRIATRNKWEWLTALRLNNRKVNRLISPLPLSEIAAAGIETGYCDLTGDDYRRFVQSPAIRSWAGRPFFHSKITEYLVTATLLELTPESRLLDAAGGSTAEYLRAVRDHVGGIDGYIQDPYAAPELSEQFTVINGSIDSIPLPDDSLDAISCHHSIEHFRGDLDSRFICEAVRVLRPGGRLVIVPIFLTDTYAEIWNQELGENDDQARQIHDRTATFAGWGPYEGFARTYDLARFEGRLLDRIQGCSIRVLQIRIDGEAVPDLTANKHQPRLNGEMKALLVEKLQGAAAES